MDIEQNKKWTSVSEQTQFKHLFTPIKVGPVTLRNRITTTPFSTGQVERTPKLGYPGDPGYYGKRYAYYLAERAKGGAAMVTFGGVCVHPTNAHAVPSIEAIGWDKEAIPGMRMAVEMVHEAGGKIFIQLIHHGAHVGALSKFPAWAPSAVPSPGTMLGRGMAKAMEKEDIQEVIKYFGLCAENAVEAGFDGIELQGGVSYLLHQFHSPLWNKRTDEYGGSLHNRLRFTMQVIDKVKSIIGNSLALGFRLSVDDVLPGGLGIEDLKEIAKALEATGKIDFLTVCPSMHGGSVGMTMYDPHFPLMPYCAALKQVGRIPVVANVRIVDPREAEKIVSDGHADLIAMTRALHADPEIANKAKEGRLDEIRLCNACNQLCHGHILRGIATECTQNPVAGFGEELWGIGTMKPANKRKRLIVIGGGPGGMEAAWVAAARGHEVTLYEKNRELGGQVKLAAKLPGRAQSHWWTQWRKVMIAKHGVKVVLEKEMTAEEVLRENPDAVVVATGSTPLRDGFQGVTMHPIPGWESPNVMVVDDVLEGKEVTTDKVVILDEEAHIKGVGIADLLSRQGKQVEIVARHPIIGNDLDLMTNARAQQIMAEKGVKVTPFSFIAGIEKDKVTLFNIYTQAMRVVEGPVTVILITGRKANEDLYFDLKGRVKELHRVGDCLAPRLVGAAIYDGHKVGREI